MFCLEVLVTQGNMAKGTVSILCLCTGVYEIMIGRALQHSTDFSSDYTI